MRYLPHFCNDRQNHGTPLGLPPQIFTECVANLRFDAAPVIDAARLQESNTSMTTLRHPSISVSDSLTYTKPLDTISGPASISPGAPTQRKHDNQKAVLCQKLTIPQYDIADIADTQAIHQDVLHLHMIDNLAVHFIQLQYIADHSSGKYPPTDVPSPNQVLMRRRCLYSPCTGMKNLGFRSAYTIFSSS